MERMDMHSRGEHLKVVRKSYIPWGICEHIEQKNWTHVRKIFGYLRHGTYEEVAIY